MSSDIEPLLRAWGLYYGERPRPPRADRTVAHTLARVAQFAECRPGRAVKHATRKLVGRDGRSRRMIMGKAAGLAGPVPMDYCNPVPAPRDGGGGRGSYTERPVPPELQRVNQAVKALEGRDIVRGLCVRAHYCVEGSREDRADWVTVEIRKFKRNAEAITVNQLKAEVAFGKVWLEGRLTWQPASVLAGS